MTNSESRFGRWNTVYTPDGERKMYDGDQSSHIGANFLNDPDVNTIEDWGCGWGGFQTLVAPHQEYIGVDGSHTPYAAKIVDLETYTSDSDGIFMRAVLEHNPGWENILKNAMRSFKKKMVLILFTPFQEQTQVIKEYDNWMGTGQTMVDIGFEKTDITKHFEGFKWTDKSMFTATQYGVEYIFLIEHQSE